MLLNTKGEGNNLAKKRFLGHLVCIYYQYKIPAMINNIYLLNMSDCSITDETHTLDVGDAGKR